MTRPPHDIDPDAATRDGLLPRVGPRSHDEAETVVGGHAAPVPQRALPDRVGVYRVDAVLGAGAMGVVARGLDEALDRPVALKFLSSQLAASDRELSRIQREGRLLQAVSHAHVVPLLAVAESDGLPVLVLELVEGGSLEDRLKEGPFSVVETIRIGAQVASALAEAHRLGIVHRDLKPANVLLDGNGNAKVSDFGLACRVVDAATPRSLASETVDLDDGVLAGTPAYMSPEHISSGEPAPTDDVWALGCVLHECLTGRRAPGPGRAPSSPGEGGPPVLTALISRCFHGEAGGSRFADGAEALAAIREAHEAITGEPLAMSVPTQTRPAPTTARRMPRPRSRFVGRRRELVGVDALLRKRRLVTLTGAGGSGKTRLALEVGLILESEGGRLADGAAFVELATLEATDSVASRLAEALDVSEQGEGATLDAVVEHLRTRSLLLVLDNCEHVMDSLREVVTRLIDDCPRLRILTTSREPLKLPGEGLVPVEPLPLPESETADAESLLDCDAVALFVDRAQQARYGFTLDTESAPWVVRCCRRLDGIPLALELAAARLRTQPLEDLVQELEQSLRGLEGGHQAALPQHRALHATIDWSCLRLSPQERTLYRSLSVFAGAFTLELVEPVGAAGELPRAEVLPLLIRLVEQSLVQEQPDGALPAWRMLVPIREHAAEQLDALDERDAARAALIRAVTELAVASKPRFDEAGMSDAVAELAVQHATLVATARICAEVGDAESGLRIFSGLGGYWHLRELWRDALELGDRLLAIAEDVPPEVRAAALLASAQLMLPLGDVPSAEERLEEAVSLFRDTDAGSRSLELAEALNTLGLATCERMDFERARTLSEQSLELAEAGGWRSQCISCRNQLGKVASLRGDQDGAREHLDQALELQRETPSPYALAAILTNLGVVAIRQKDLPAARGYLEEALQASREAKTQRGELFVILNLAAVSEREGRADESLQLHRRAAHLCRELSDHGATLILMVRFARIALRRDEPERAGRILGAADALRRASGAEQFQDQAGYDEMSGEAREALGEASYELELAAGRELDLEGALALAESVGR